jgi:hypothetical protein
LPDKPGLRGPHPGQPHHFEQVLGVPLAQLLQKGYLAGRQVLEHLTLNGRAYPRKLAQRPTLGYLGDGHRVLAERGPRLLVGEDAVGGLAFERQVVGDGVEQAGELAVGGQSVGISAHGRHRA